MPSRKITITLNDAEQAMCNKLRWCGQPWAGIADKIRIALRDQITATPRLRAQVDYEVCMACGQAVRILANGFIWDHRAGGRQCAGTGSNLYLARGCTCGQAAQSCYCGAAANVQFTATPR